MKDNEKDMKMQLLEQLMASMDDSVGNKLKPSKDPMVEVVKEEHQEMPLSEAKDMIKEKMMGSEEEEVIEEEESDDEMEEYDEEDEEYSGSSLMERLREMRKKKEHSEE